MPAATFVENYPAAEVLLPARKEKAVSPIPPVRCYTET